jgi:hypothetical protein
VPRAISAGGKHQGELLIIRAGNAAAPPKEKSAAAVGSTQRLPKTRAEPDSSRSWRCVSAIRLPMLLVRYRAKLQFQPQQDKAVRSSMSTPSHSERMYSFENPAEFGRQHLLDYTREMRDLVGGQLAFPFRCRFHWISEEAEISLAAVAARALLDKAFGLHHP